MTSVVSYWIIDVKCFIEMKSKSLYLEYFNVIRRFKLLSTLDTLEMESIKQRTSPIVSSGDLMNSSWITSMTTQLRLIAFFCDINV